MISFYFSSYPNSLVIGMERAIAPSMLMGREMCIRDSACVMRLHDCSPRFLRQIKFYKLEGFFEVLPNMFEYVKEMLSCLNIFIVIVPVRALSVGRLRRLL